MSNELRQGKIMIGNTQIVNSANIVETDDNVWEEDLGHIFVKYTYTNKGKDLIIEWEEKE